MRRLVLALVVAATVAPGLAAQNTPDEDAVLQMVENLFAYMKDGDAGAMAELMHDDVRLVSTTTRDGVPVTRVMAIEGWLESVGNSERELDEQIHDSLVRVSGGLAVVWTYYDLYVDGQHSHCGVDLFDLVRTSEGWKIIGIADTRSSEGCRG